jgi:hypothetical protein
MRAFLKQFAAFALIQLLIAAAVFWSYRRQYPADQNMLAASIDKHALISTQASPRLIFIGGSSMAFGVKSAEVAAACVRHPVNMGLHGALGLSYMLNESEPFIRKDDWIILAPEYQQFARINGTTDYVVNMLEVNPANAALLESAQWAEAFDRGLLQRFGRMARSVLGKPGRFFREGQLSKAARPFHRRTGFNTHGDMAAHLDLKSPGLSEGVFRFRYREELVTQAIARMNDFAKSAEARGAKVFFSHPPLPREIFAVNREHLDKLEARLKAELKIPRLDRMDEHLYPIEDFFDTWYHLAAPGVEKRTRFLAERLAQQASLSPTVHGQIHQDTRKQ